MENINVKDPGLIISSIDAVAIIAIGTVGYIKYSNLEERVTKIENSMSNDITSVLKSNKENKLQMESLKSYVQTITNDIKTRSNDNYIKNLENGINNINNILIQLANKMSEHDAKILQIMQQQNQILKNGTSNTTSTITTSTTNSDINKIQKIEDPDSDLHELESIF